MRQILLCIVSGIALAVAAQADTIALSLDTSLLVGNASGPFSLGFELADGSLTGDGNNAVSLSNFQFGAGSATGSSSTFGTASGDLSSSVLMTDLGIFSGLSQGFDPGNTLVFDISFTNNVDLGGTPDEFAFFILDSTDTPIPTTGGIALFQIDFGLATPTISTFAGDTSQSGGIGLPAPTYSSVSSAPEPATAALCGIPLVLTFLVLRRRRMRL
jgi:hypothetical protein